MRQKLVPYLISQLDASRIDAEFSEASGGAEECSLERFAIWFEKFDLYLLEFYPEVQRAHFNLPSNNRGGAAWRDSRRSSNDRVPLPGDRWREPGKPEHVMGRRFSLIRQHNAYGSMNDRVPLPGDPRPVKQEPPVMGNPRRFSLIRQASNLRAELRGGQTSPGAAAAPSKGQPPQRQRQQQPADSDGGGEADDAGASSFLAGVQKAAHIQVGIDAGYAA